MCQISSKSIISFYVIEQHISNHTNFHIIIDIDIDHYRLKNNCTNITTLINKYIYT